MTTPEYTLLWPDLVAMRPEKVVITGGEPLMRDDLLELLDGLRRADPEHHVARCLNSNGHLVTSDLARRLVGLADEVRVSLDALPDRNDALRGRGNFDAAMQALETYYAVGFEPKILVTITSVSLPDLEELLCLLIGRKFTRINVNSFRPTGRGAGHEEMRADPVEVQSALRRAWSRCYPNQVPPTKPLEPDVHSHCGVGQFLNIMPNGDVFPCHVLTDREFCCGNVREKSLFDICRRTGLLGQLATLDFRELTRSADCFTPLARPGACLGEVYARTKASPAWRDNPSLPILY
jgi:radical SAM protein with 4Fe4S-binding SPASM domain